MLSFVQLHTEFYNSMQIGTILVARFLYFLIKKICSLFQLHGHYGVWCMETITTQFVAYKRSEEVV